MKTTTWGAPIERIGARLVRPPSRRNWFLLAALLIAAVAGYIVYSQIFAASQVVAPPQTVPARTGPLVSTVSATGTVVAAKQAKLSFPSAGRVADIKVNVGDVVKAGQELARLDAQQLQIKVDQAQSALKTSQIKLQQLKDGATQDEIAAAQSAYDAAVAKLNDVTAGPTKGEAQSAQSAVDQAKASLVSAQAKLDQLTSGPTQADQAAAQGAVDQANATLAAAQAKLDQVKAGATPADLATAQGAVDQANATLAAAQAKLDQVKSNFYTDADWVTAQSAVDSNRAALKSAQAKLDQVKAGPTAADLSAAQQAVVQAQASAASAADRYEMAVNGNLKESGGTSNSALKDAYDAAKASLDAANQKLAQLTAGPLPADLQSAQSAVDQAQANYNAAAAKVEQMKKGALPADLAAAQSAVDQAKASLTSSQAKLDQVKAGPTDADVAAAQSAVDQANSSVTTAQAKLDQLMAGPLNTDLASARSAVDSARAALAGAQGKLSDVMAGPKAGDVETANSAVASAQSTLTSKTSGPKETDLGLAMEQVNQSEIALRQAQLDLQNATLVAPFDGTISAIGANVGEQVASAPVVTLIDPGTARVDATVDESDVAKVAVGQAAAVTFDALPDQRFQGKVLAISPAGTNQQGVVSYSVSIGLDAQGRTLPAGMTAAVSVETSRKNDALLVPSRAVRTQGRSKVVEVWVGGKVENRTVETGASNDQFTEITSGVGPGDQVVIPSTTTAQPRTNFGPGGPGAVNGGPPAGGGANFRPAGR